MLNHVTDSVVRAVIDIDGALNLISDRIQSYKPNVSQTWLRIYLNRIRDHALEIENAADEFLNQRPERSVFSPHTRPIAQCLATHYLYIADFKDSHGYEQDDDNARIEVNICAAAMYLACYYYSPFVSDLRGTSGDNVSPRIDSGLFDPACRELASCFAILLSSYIYYKHHDQDGFIDFVGLSNILITDIREIVASVPHLSMPLLVAIFRAIDNVNHMFRYCRNHGITDRQQHNMILKSTLATIKAAKLLI